MNQCAWKHCNNPAVSTPKNFCSRSCKNKFHVDNRRKKLKEMAVEYLGGKCQRCGYVGHQAALVPHHKDPSQKEFALGGGGITRAWVKVQEELDKCVLLCSNCHLTIHATNDPEWITDPV